MDTSGSEGEGDQEEDSYKILSQSYKERKDLLYHTADPWWPSVEETKRKYYTSIISSYYHSYIKRKCFLDRTIRWDGAELVQT